MKAWQMILALGVMACIGCGGSVSKTEDDNANGSVDEQTEDTELVKARPGMSKKAQNLGDDPLASKAKALVMVREKVEIDIKLKKSMDLYRGLHGYYPKTQKEFIEKIIDENKIKLPKLPEGQKYVYDPKTGELLIERPQQ